MMKLAQEYHGLTRGPHVQDNCKGSAVIISSPMKWHKLHGDHIRFQSSGELWGNQTVNRLQTQNDEVFNSRSWACSKVGQRFTLIARSNRIKAVANIEIGVLTTPPSDGTANVFAVMGITGCGRRHEVIDPFLVPLDNSQNRQIVLVMDVIPGQTYSLHVGIGIRLDLFGSGTKLNASMECLQEPLDLSVTEYLLENNIKGPLTHQNLAKWCW